MEVNLQTTKREHEPMWKLITCEMYCHIVSLYRSRHTRQATSAFGNRSTCSYMTTQRAVQSLARRNLISLDLANGGLLVPTEDSWQIYWRIRRTSIPSNSTYRLKPLHLRCSDIAYWERKPSVWSIAISSLSEWTRSGLSVGYWQVRCW